MSDDLISRQAAIDAFHTHFKDGFEDDRWWNSTHVLMAIKEVPSAEPERKTGKWIWDDEGYHCSECFFHAYGNTLECIDGTYKYCPNCGARMEDNDG